MLRSDMACRTTLWRTAHRDKIADVRRSARMVLAQALADRIDTAKTIARDAVDTCDPSRKLNTDGRGRAPLRGAPKFRVEASCRRERSSIVAVS